MANYAIFDEKYYLAQYPWIKPAIDVGALKSGREHFEKFGQAGGLTKVSRYFDEATYLAGNPDIAALVRTPSNPNGTFATGLDHFIKFGYEEGRSRVSAEYDEAFYLANNRNLQPFIQNGTFKSGYQHFIKFGIKDSASGTSFLETGYFQTQPSVQQGFAQVKYGQSIATSFLEVGYLQNNLDVLPVVQSGALKSGREHYFNFGKDEPSRSATFVGTSGNDILTSFGVGKVELIGVEVALYPSNGRVNNVGSEKTGTDEFDTLIGGSGRDTFMLSNAYLDFPRLTPVTQGLYIGPGFATIRNFTKGQDSIQLVNTLSSSFADQYLISPINNNRDLAIQRKASPFAVPGTDPLDTIAVIEGGGDLSLNVLPALPSSNVFTSLIG
jgi:Ca2+-binding RTX toxin-like protein